MSWAIIRNVKYKMSNLQSISRHNERQNKHYGNKDIDTEKSHLNHHLKEPIEKSYEKEFYRLREENNLKGNLRLTGAKQSNVACEFLITSDYDFFESLNQDQRERFFEDAHDFACKKCGDDNIISSVVHYDETTPHMHIMYIPVVEGTKKGQPIKKVNCSEFWAGYNSYGILQDEFHEFIIEKGWKLERGKRNEDRDEKREHLSVEEFKIKTLREREQKIKELAEINEKLDSVKEITTKKIPLSKDVRVNEEEIERLKRIAEKDIALTYENREIAAAKKRFQESSYEKDREYSKVLKENKGLKKEITVRDKYIDDLKESVIDFIKGFDLKDLWEQHKENRRKKAEKKKQEELKIKESIDKERKERSKNKGYER